MSRYRPRTSVPAAPGEQPARNQAPALAGDGTDTRPGQGPTRCEACGHVTVPVLRCVCGHGVGFHNLATDNVTRKACSTSSGPGATQCPCRLFVPTTPEDAS